MLGTNGEFKFTRNTLSLLLLLLLLLFHNTFMHHMKPISRPHNLLAATAAAAAAAASLAASCAITSSTIAPPSLTALNKGSSWGRDGTERDISAAMRECCCAMVLLRDCDARASACVRGTEAGLGRALSCVRDRSRGLRMEEWAVMRVCMPCTRRRYVSICSDVHGVGSDWHVPCDDARAQEDCCMHTPAAAAAAERTACSHSMAAARAVVEGGVGEERSDT